MLSKADDSTNFHPLTVYSSHMHEVRHPGVQVRSLLDSSLDQHCSGAQVHPTGDT